MTYDEYEATLWTTRVDGLTICEGCLYRPRPGVYSTLCLAGRTLRTTMPTSCNLFRRRKTGEIPEEEQEMSDASTTMQRITSEVTREKRLSSGYVLLTGRSWAQMPENEWEALRPGESIPDRYTFNPGWWDLRKPNIATEKEVLDE